MIELVGLSLVH